MNEAALAAKLAQVDIIYQKWGDGFRRITYPSAVCVLPLPPQGQAQGQGYPLTEFSVSYAQLQRWRKAGFVVPPSEEWMYRHTEGTPRGESLPVSYFLPAPIEDVTGAAEDRPLTINEIAYVVGKGATLTKHSESIYTLTWKAENGVGLTRGVSPHKVKQLVLQGVLGEVQVPNDPGATDPFRIELHLATPEPA